MKASVDLPIEIWQQIYDHMPKSKAIRLYEVNRPLYHIVMSEKYAHVHCDWYSLAHPVQRAYALRSQTTTRYIQTLTLSLNSLLMHFNVSLVGTRARIETTKAIQELRQMSSDIAALSPRFPALRTLTIMADEQRNFYHMYRHLKDNLKVSAGKAMQSVSHTLRVLDLRQVPLEFFRDGLISETLVLPLLENFCMDIFTIYNTTDYESILQTLIAPFVNRHSHSLKRLEFKNRDIRRSPGFLYRYGKLFQHLTHIPCLIDLSIRFTLLISDTASLDELSRFIHAHSASLSSLRLCLYHSTLGCLAPKRVGPASQLELDVISRAHTPQTLFSHPLFSQTLPFCYAMKDIYCILLSEDALQIDPTPFLSWLPTVTYAANLTTLSLPYNVLNQSDLICLVSTADLSALWRLRVKVQAFDMTLFDAFAIKLLNLRELTISTHALFCKLVDGSQVEWTPVTQLAPYSPFLAELRTHSYVQWRTLVKLSMTMIHKRYEQRTCQFGCCHYPFLPIKWMTEEQMQVAFPYIQHFEAEVRPFDT